MKHLASLGILLVLQHSVFADPGLPSRSLLRLGPQLLAADGTIYTAHVPTTRALLAVDLDHQRVGLGVELARRGDATVNTVVLAPSYQTQPQEQPAGAEVLLAVGFSLR